MKIFSVISSCILLFLASYSLFACSCAIDDPPSVFNRAELVFVGRVIDGSEEFLTTSAAGAERKLVAGDVKFSVTRVYKGRRTKNVNIFVASFRNTSCEYGLARGETYLMYVERSDEGAGRLTDGPCTRSAPAKSDFPKKDFAFLDHLPPKGSGGNLHGWVLVGDSLTPLPNIRLLITRRGSRPILVKTNAKREFYLRGRRPGAYLVTPRLPKQYVSDMKEISVSVSDRGTGNATFYALPQNQE